MTSFKNPAYVEAADDGFEGWLYKQSPKKMAGFQRRWFYLKNGQLKYYKEAKNTSEFETFGRNKTLKPPIALQDIKDIMDHYDDPNLSKQPQLEFQFTSGEKKFRLRADTPEIKEAWMKALTWVKEGSNGPPPSPPPPPTLEQIKQIEKTLLEDLKEHAQDTLVHTETVDKSGPNILDPKKLMSEVKTGKELKHVEVKDKSEPVIENVTIKKIDRGAHLDAIQGGSKLKHVDTEDRSEPVIDKNVKLQESGRGALMDAITKKN